MFRSLILLIAIGLVIWLLSRMFKNKANQGNPDSSNNKQQIKNIVQCQQCQAFIPEDKAIRENNQVFCSQKHLQEWKESH